MPVVGGGVYALEVPGSPGGGAQEEGDGEGNGEGEGDGCPSWDEFDNRQVVLTELPVECSARGQKNGL